MPPDQTPIKRIDVKVQTGDVDGADTNGQVYLFIAGREFRVNNERANDRQRRATDNMAFGDVPASDKLAVQFPDRNDPRQPKLMFEDLDKSPVWLRFVPANADDEWNVDFVQVIVKAGSKTQTYEALPHPNDTLWLGNKGGLYLNLSKVT